MWAKRPTQETGPRQKHDTTMSNSKSDCERGQPAKHVSGAWSKKPVNSLKNRDPDHELADESEQTDTEELTEAHVNLNQSHEHSSDTDDNGDKSDQTDRPDQQEQRDQDDQDDQENESDENSEVEDMDTDYFMGDVEDLRGGNILTDAQFFVKPQHYGLGEIFYQGSKCNGKVGVDESVRREAIKSFGPSRGPSSSTSSKYARYSGYQARSMAAHDEDEDEAVSAEDRERGLDIELFADINTTLTNYNHDDLDILLQQLYNKFVQDGQKAGDVRDKAYQLWGINPLSDRPTAQYIEDQYRKHVLQCMRLYQQFVDSNYVGQDDERPLTNRTLFAKVFESVSTMRELVLAEQKLVSLGDPDHDMAYPKDLQIHKFSFVDYSQNDDYINLLLFLLSELYRRRLRRFQGDCYRQIQTPEGHFTHAWTKECTIEEFINGSISKETRYHLWCVLTKQNKRRDAIAHLTTCRDLEFPELVPDRHIFAFRNGIYLAAENRFCSYREHPVDDNVVACNYIPYEFDFVSFVREEKWSDIETPVITSILQDQQLKENAIRMFFVFFGRMFYNLGEKDDWQCAPFIKGKANTGKSTIAHLFEEIYPKEVIGNLSSNAEEKFGLSALVEKWIILCTEVKAKFKLNQSEFQQMISGDRALVNIKGKTAVSYDFLSPLFLFGNESAAWLDASNSIRRRLIYWFFEVTITDTKPNFRKLLKEELPAIIYKANTAYLEAVRTKSTQGIWDWIDGEEGENGYFHETSRRAAASIHPLLHFLEYQDALVRHKEAYMPMKDFQKLHNEHIATNGLRAGPWSKDYYGSVFEEKQIYVRMNEVLMWKGQPLRQHWVTGIGPKEYFRDPGSIEPLELVAEHAVAQMGSNSSSSSSSSSLDSSGSSSSSSGDDGQSSRSHKFIKGSHSSSLSSSSSSSASSSSSLSVYD